MVSLLGVTDCRTSWSHEFVFRVLAKLLLATGWFAGLIWAAPSSFAKTVSPSEDMPVGLLVPIGVLTYVWLFDLIGKWWCVHVRGDLRQYRFVALAAGGVPGAMVLIAAPYLLITTGTLPQPLLEALFFFGGAPFYLGIDALYHWKYGSRET